MTNDAKSGLVVGVGLVVVVAVVFYRQELATAPAAGGSPSAVTTTSHSAGSGSGLPRAVTPTSARRMAERRPGFNHTVREGETLFSLAEQYYGDGRQYMQIYHANEKVLSSPDAVTAGMVLFIPELPAQQPLRPD